jgi:hypothetical protein
MILAKDEKPQFKEFTSSGIHDRIYEEFANIVCGDAEKNIIEFHNKYGDIIWDGCDSINIGSIARRIDVVRRLLSMLKEKKHEEMLVSVLGNNEIRPVKSGLISFQRDGGRPYIKILTRSLEDFIHLQIIMLAEKGTRIICCPHCHRFATPKRNRSTEQTCGRKVCQNALSRKGIRRKATLAAPIHEIQA